MLQMNKVLQHIHIELYPAKKKKEGDKCNNMDKFQKQLHCEETYCMKGNFLKMNILVHIRKEVFRVSQPRGKLE